MASARVYHPAPHRRLSRRWHVLAALLAACLGGCIGFDDPARPAAEFAIDQDALGATDASWVVRVSSHVDAERTDLATAVRLERGERRLPIRVEIAVVERGLRLTPLEPLEPGATYRLRFDAEALALHGEQVPDDAELEVRVSEDAQPAPTRPPLTYDATLGAVVEEHCGCHARPEEALPSLAYERILNVPSRTNPEVALVVPFDTGASYLLRKLSADHPSRSGDVMPPAWSGLEGPSAEARREIELWISQGASP